MSSEVNCGCVFSDAVQLVEKHMEQESGGSSGEDAALPLLHARRLLEQLVEQSAVQAARHMLDLLLTHRVVTPSGSLFHPFIKAHLAK